MKTLLSSLFLSFACVSCAFADDFSFTDGLNTRAQFGSKVIGITIVASCPFSNVIDLIKEKGQEYGKGLSLPNGSVYTVFLPVIGQENCPANLYGSVYPYLARESIDDLTSFRFALGVTVGVHYGDFR